MAREASLTFLFQHAADSGVAYLRGVGDLTQTLTVGAVLQDRRPIETEWDATDVAALQPGAHHAGTHSLDDQATF